MALFKKTSLRRDQVRKNMPVEGFARLNRLISTDIIASLLLWVLFVTACVPIISFEFIRDARQLGLLLTAVVILLICVGGAFYVSLYQKRIIQNHARAMALAGLFVLMLVATKLGVLLSGRSFWATGGAVIVGIILVIAYDQRFAIGMSVLYCLLGCLAAGGRSLNNSNLLEYELVDIGLLLTMVSGAIACCFSLREIRTRMKLINVSVCSAVIVFIAALSMSLMGDQMPTGKGFAGAGYHGAVTLIVGLLIQSLLPVIEKVFHIATSMTLLDYSDANQPLLKRLAMEAPGTFSHSLFIGSIAEAAAETVGRNGLLCRVGAYYHDIGKLNKPGYFVENEMGSASRHKELSPAMSQLIIIGHVKDGIEMAKAYGLPAVIRQFIETHHGTTLVVPFYTEAKKKHDSANGKGGKPKEAPPAESEFRYGGPRPRSKEAGIVMLSDAVEGAVRAMAERTPAKIETAVHNIAMRRLQDGQLDECDLSLRELNQIGTSISKTLAAHYHGRIAYPTAPDAPLDGPMGGSENRQNNS